MAYITAAPQARPLFRATQIVWYLLDLVEVLLGIRFILSLLGANIGATFSNIIYSLTGPLVAPFRNVFGSSSVGGYTVEWGTLLAMIVYWLLAWGLVKLFTMGRPVSTIDASERLYEQDTTVR
jgi:hypothetical protein